MLRGYVQYKQTKYMYNKKKQNPSNWIADLWYPEKNPVNFLSRTVCG